jgi:hypothetical protein
MERYAGMVPEALETLSPQERHRVYRMLRLKVVAHPDNTMEVQGVFGDRCLGTQDVLQRPEPRTVGGCRSSGPLIEAGAPSAEEATPPGVVMIASQAIAQRCEGAKHRPCQVRREPSAAQDIIEAGIIHLASLQRGSLILREDCHNVVTTAPTVGTDSVLPDSKRERGVHARYALLGTRSSGGGWRPGDRLGVVPIGAPLALAAGRGPGLTHSTFPARQRRARGRIEHTPLDEGRSSSPTDLRPSLATPPYHKKVPNVSICDKGPGPRRATAWPGRCGCYSSSMKVISTLTL